MARVFSRTSRNYQAGTYGPFAIDSFTQNDSTGVRLTLTVENWPNVPVLGVLTLTMDNGAQATINIPGRPKNRDGTDKTVFAPELGIPEDGTFIDGVKQPAVKRATTNGSVTVELFQSARTAITFEAI